MSAWRLMLSELYERGPLFANQFRHYGKSLPHQAFATALRLGLAIGRINNGNVRPYELTDVGRDVIEGRAVVVCDPPMKRGGKLRVRPTWISALPRTNEIRTGTQ